jgi:hypothetical protein
MLSFLLFIRQFTVKAALPLQQQHHICFYCSFYVIYSLISLCMQGKHRPERKSAVRRHHCDEPARVHGGPLRHRQERRSGRRTRGRSGPRGNGRCHARRCLQCQSDSGPSKVPKGRQAFGCSSSFKTSVDHCVFGLQHYLNMVGFCFETRRLCSDSPLLCEERNTCCDITHVYCLRGTHQPFFLVQPAYHQVLQCLCIFFLFYRAKKLNAGSINVNSLEKFLHQQKSAVYFTYSCLMIGTFRQIDCPQGYLLNKTVCRVQGSV